jgi:putative intracellular protease/amidase
MKKVFIFLFDGFSDWEIAFLTPEIRKSSDFQIVYFSKDGEPVSSMGGLRVSPETSLTAIHHGDVEMLILPGGTAWEKGENDFMDTFVKSVFDNGKTVAAICAATAYLANNGFLNALKHTSNDLYYLKAVAPLYTGEQHYIGSLAVTDQNLITANGVAPIEFAREIFRKLNLYNETNIEKWFQLFKNGIWSE